MTRRITPSSPPRPPRRTLRRAAVTALLLAGVAAGLSAPPAYAAAGVSISSPLGGATADAEYATTLQVSGSGFQSIQGGFGGVYVLFGWAGEGWRPSEGGVVGSDYRYIPDSEARDNQGFQRFVAFPGSETESAAQAVMGADGSWSVDMVVPGATFTALDREGDAVQVDCRQVQCGVLTIGAHGVTNANNETFTPVAFTAGGQGAAAETGGGTDAAPTDGAAQTATGAPVGDLRIGFDPAAAVAGNAFAFTARGFVPGEQVVATLDRGAVAVGPLTAGASGEVAGVLPLPGDLAAGTHVLQVTGAASGGVAESEVVVSAGALALVDRPAQPAVPAWLYAAMAIAIALALTLLVANVVVRIVRALRRRRSAARDTESASPDSSPADADAAAPAPASEHADRAGVPA